MKRLSEGKMAIRDKALMRRLDDIAALAEAVANEHSSTDCIDPESIIQRNGITLSYGRYEDAFDGMLEHISGRFHVYANLSRLRLSCSGRARFTLAHELGHYYIDDHRHALQTGMALSHPSFTDHQSKNPVEIEADHFACNLLMPSARFVADAQRKPIGLSTILALKDSFGTSITSTSIRFAQLNLGACTVVKWDENGFAWKWFSRDTFNAGYRRTIENISEVPVDSPTGRALAGQAPPSEGFFSSGTLASAWFRGVNPGTPRDVVLIEQAISLGQFGVISFLFPEQNSLV